MMSAEWQATHAPSAMLLPGPSGSGRSAVPSSGSAPGSLTEGVAGFFWTQGARLVMPFAGCGLLAVAAAMLAFARHAGDRERIALGDGRLRVETIDGGRVERIEFAQDAVRVEAGDGGSLIELTSRGERIAVGRHVRPELRPWLAAELRDALREQPRGVTG